MGGGFSGIQNLLGGQTPEAFGPEIFKRKQPERKLQFAGDIESIAGVSDLRGGRLGLGESAKYYEGILSGDRQKALETVAPEAGSILSAYDTAKRAASEFSPRGGGRNAALQELPYRESGDITSLLQKVRPEAAKELTAISEFLS